MFTSSVDSGWFPTCAVFDCDGVLLDSETVWGEIQNEFFEKYGVTPSAEDRAQLVGSAASDLAEAIVRLSDTSDQSEAETMKFREEVLADVQETEMNIVDRGIETIPGALDVIKKLASAMPVAVASNSSSKLLTKKLEKFGHAEVLTTWVGANDVENPKPAPDMYSEAIRRLGGTPERTFTVEDSAAGAKAARTAGSNTFIFCQDPEDAPEGKGYFSSFTDPEFLAQIDRWVEKAQEHQG